MDFAAIIDGGESFAAYVGELASVIGHVGRVAPLHDYCAGLLPRGTSDYSSNRCLLSADVGLWRVLALPTGSSIQCPS
jgi:hypothetical protein